MSAYFVYSICVLEWRSEDVHVSGDFSARLLYELHVGHEVVRKK